MLFYFPKTQEPLSDQPIYRIGGELLVDCGNEDFSYIFRAQERYLPYTCMLQANSLFFFKDGSHRENYLKRFSIFQDYQTILKKYSGFAPPTILPKFVKLTAKSKIPTLDSDFPKNGIFINQLSPILVNILEAIASKASVNYDLNQYAQIAQLVLRFSSKAEYIRLVKQHKSEELPWHTETLILQEDVFFSISFIDLKQQFYEETGQTCDEFFVKSAVDAGGEISGVLDQANFDQKMAKLRQEAEEKPRDTKIEILIQRRLSGSSCIGFSYHIQASDQIERIVASGQIYEDEERKEFLGAIVSDELEQAIFQKVDEAKVINLCRLFANLGYRGPINFDAIENELGDYEFVGDCNPRLSGVYPNLSVKIFLNQQGVKVTSLANLGYRGRIRLAHFEQTLKSLEHQNLLFSPSREQGIWIIPSFTGDHHFDFWFINMPRGAIETFVQSDFFYGILHSEYCDIGGIYF